MATNYAAITKADEKSIDGGYQNMIWFAPVADFLSIAKPSGTPAALGDKVTISTDHTFESPKGFYGWRMKKHSVTITGEPVGDAGARSINWKLACIVLGDSASTQEQMQNMLNDDVIFLVKDQDCDDTTHIQLGDECLTPEASISFNGNTTAEGYKEYALELTVKKKKFFYTGTVTEAGESTG